MERDEQINLVAGVRFRLLIFWYFLFFMSAFLLVLPFVLPHQVPVPGVSPVWKNGMFILYVLHLAGIYYLKRTWLNSRVLTQIAASEFDASKSFGLPLAPIPGELDIAGGVFYHLRRSLFLLYGIALAALVLTGIYYAVFAIRQDIYTYAIILMIFLLINYPRADFFKFLIDYSEEETHDS